MIALCVDDEKVLLNTLTRAVEASPDITEVVSFRQEKEALEWSQTNTPDIAFLDIELHRMTGIDLAEQLLALHPDMGVVFCTGYDNYAIDVINRRIQAYGYLTKPIRPDKVQATVQRFLEARSGTKPLITVRRYGGFAVYDTNGNPVIFQRKRSEELLALLIHLKGKPVPVTTICDYLWQDNTTMFENNRNYVWKLFSSLKTTLQAVDAVDAVKRSPEGHYADLSVIRLDDSGSDILPYLPAYIWSKRPPE